MILQVAPAARLAQLELDTPKSGPFTDVPLKVIVEVPRLVATIARAPLVVPGACGVEKGR